MNKKGAFSIGLALGLTLGGIAFYFLSAEAKRLQESLFISGYMNEISTLTFLLNEEEELAKKEIALSELCEAISIIGGKFKETDYSHSYIEIVASMSVSAYQDKLSSLHNEHCSKNT